MKASERRIAIEELITEQGETDFVSLARQFGVSEMTIRRDIERLEERGVVRRVFGGAIPSGKATEPSFESRTQSAATSKAHIAEAVVALLSPHETVIIDSGSTALAVARAIRGKGLGLTVVTPSILGALELVDEPDTTVLLTGGQLRPGELSMIGSEAEAAFELYNCDTYIAGVAGVDAARGLSEYHRGEGHVKKAALQAADRVIVAADHSKLGRFQLLNVAPLEAIDALVADCDEDHPVVAAARAKGVTVVCVEPPSSTEESA